MHRIRLSVIRYTYNGETVAARETISYIHKIYQLQLHLIVHRRIIPSEQSADFLFAYDYHIMCT